MVTVSVSRSTAISDLIVTRAVSAIAELLYIIHYLYQEHFLMRCYIRECHRWTTIILKILHVVFRRHWYSWLL